MLLEFNVNERIYKITKKDGDISTYCKCTFYFSPQWQQEQIYITFKSEQYEDTICAGSHNEKFTCIVPKRIFNSSEFKILIYSNNYTTNTVLINICNSTYPKIEMCEQKETNTVTGYVKKEDINILLDNDGRFIFQY